MKYGTKHSQILFFFCSLSFIILASGLFQGSGYEFFFSLAYCLAMIQGPYIVFRRRSYLLISGILVLFSWGLNQWARASDEHLVRIISGINWTLFNGYITWLMHRYTRRTERVELDHILVVVITYILIGLTYSSAYVNLLFIDPTSFNIDPALLQSEKEAWQVLLYYSFMTLTTVGYGDITPHTHLARMLASSEAIMGVMFIAIFVARMISMYVGDRSR